MNSVICTRKALSGKSLEMYSCFFDMRLPTEWEELVHVSPIACLVCETHHKYWALVETFAGMWAGHMQRVGIFGWMDHQLPSMLDPRNKLIFCSMPGLWYIHTPELIDQCGVLFVIFSLYVDWCVHKLLIVLIDMFPAMWVHSLHERRWLNHVTS